MEMVRFVELDWWCYLGLERRL